MLVGGAAAPQPSHKYYNAFIVYVARAEGRPLNCGVCRDYTKSTE